MVRSSQSRIAKKAIWSSQSRITFRYLVVLLLEVFRGPPYLGFSHRVLKKKKTKTKTKQKKNKEGTLWFIFLVRSHRGKHRSSQSQVCNQVICCLTHRNPLRGILPPCLFDCMQVSLVCLQCYRHVQLDCMIETRI